MDKYHKIAKSMDLWMSLRENGYHIDQFFIIRNIKKVGIYGYGILGRHLIWELEQSMPNIELSWIADSRAASILETNYQVYLPENIDKAEEPGVIVICAINDFEEIEEFVCEKTKVPVISLESILNECKQNLPNNELIS